MNIGKRYYTLQELIPHLFITRGNNEIEKALHALEMAFKFRNDLFHEDPFNVGRYGLKLSNLEQLPQQPPIRGNDDELVYEYLRLRQQQSPKGPLLPSNITHSGECSIFGNNIGTPNIPHNLNDIVPTSNRLPRESPPTSIEYERQSYFLPDNHPSNSYYYSTNPYSPPTHPMSYSPYPRPTNYSPPTHRVNFPERLPNELINRNPLLENGSSNIEYGHRMNPQYLREMPELVRSSIKHDKNLELNGEKNSFVQESIKSQKNLLVVSSMQKKK